MQHNDYFKHIDLIETKTATTHFRLVNNVDNAYKKKAILLRLFCFTPINIHTDTCNTKYYTITACCYHLFLFQFLIEGT